LVRREGATHRFFGRHDELDRLRQISAQPIAGRSVVAVVSGPAGIGKTRLMAKLQSSLPSGFAHRLLTRCSELDATPVEPLRMLARSALGPAAAAAGPLAPWLDVMETTDLEQARRLSRTMTGDLARRLLASRTGPSLIVIDDLHWSGDPVLDFVELLAVEMSTSHQPVLLVLLSRVVPPGHPTGIRLNHLNDHVPTHRLNLEPLDEAVDAELIRACAPGASTSLVNYIRRAAGGNPLMTLATVELVRDRVVPENLRAADPRAWPSYVPDADERDPLQRWLDQLPPEVGDPCRQMAAIGHDFSAGVAAVALGRSDAEASQALDQAVSRRLLANAGAVYWFRHDLYRDYLYRSLPTSERQAVHTRLAAATLAGPMPDPEPLAAIRLARHLLNGRPGLAATPEAATALSKGARAAFSLTSWADAARFHEAHLALAGLPLASGPGGDPEATRSQFELVLETGLAHYFNHDLGAGAERLRQAIALAKELGDDARWSSALVPLLRIMNAGDPASLQRPAELPELDEFLSQPHQQLPLARVVQVRSESLITAGRVEEGEVEARRALDLARNSQDPAAIAMAGLAHGFAALTRASPWEAIDRLEPALRVARSADDRFARNTIQTRLAIAHCSAGHLKQAQVTADVAVDEASASHEFTNQALNHATLGTVAYLRGDFGYSLRLLETAASEGRRASYAPMALLVVAARVLGLLASGTRARARRAVETADNLPGTLRNALLSQIEGRPTGPFPATRLKQLTDLNAGIAAATITAGREPGAIDLGVAFELFEQALEGGMAFPATVPVSIRRALGRAYALQGRPRSALEELTEAERLARSENAFCELALTQLDAAVLNAQLGRHRDSLRNALEAKRLAQRLGMPLVAVATRRIHDDERAAGPVQPPQRVILVSDVVGSTQVSYQQGDQAYFDLVMEHHGIVRQLLATYSGVEFSEGGDSLLAWFDLATEAIDCAQAIQAQAAHRRRAGSKLAVKIGIAGGDPFFSHGRPYGTVVNRAARLAATAEASQIIIDDVTSGYADRTGQLMTNVVQLRGMEPVTVSILAPAS
jgi:class 3 adenylate cyclase